MDEKLNWMMLAEKFIDEGNPRAIRAAARELFDLDSKSAEGPALMAESSLYLGNFDEAEMFAEDALSLEPNNVRGRYVLGALAAEKFNLKEEFSILGKVIKETHNSIDNLKLYLKNYQLRFKTAEQKNFSKKDETQREVETKIRLAKKILYKSLCTISNGLYLAGDPVGAADALQEASELTDDPERGAELYSKHLFLRNYRDIAPKEEAKLAAKFDEFFSDVTPYPHEGKNFSPDKKLKIGYISPDFREHAVVNFILPLLKYFDSKNFSVTCYQTGKKDAVTEKLKRNKVSWRDFSGRNIRTAARIISEDKIDILVDLSGHTQNSCLPVAALKPAPVQISAIGYTATTGLSAMDFFLSDKICLPEQMTVTGFTEKILRTENCHLCYSPGLIRQMPAPGATAPLLKNGFVTYGSFNNFAKVGDEVLYLWRAILEAVPDSVLVIKNKICSIPAGREMVFDRLKKVSFPLGAVKLLPYSPDYLEQYRDIDVALDTFPYNGGLTTCEALYMGVPVVTLRGKSHGSRFGASILTSADLSELIAKSSMDYIKKAVHLGRHKELTAAYHAGLREHLLQSKLMDGERYVREVEKCYREAWKIFCESR